MQPQGCPMMIEPYGASAALTFVKAVSKQKDRFEGDLSAISGSVCINQQLPLLPPAERANCAQAGGEEGKRARK